MSEINQVIPIYSKAPQKCSEGRMCAVRGRDYCGVRHNSDLVYTSRLSTYPIQTLYQTLLKMSIT